MLAITTKQQNGRKNKRKKWILFLPRFPRLESKFQLEFGQKN